MSWLNKFKERLAIWQGRPTMDTLLSRANPTLPLSARLDWAEDLLAWIRLDVPATRLRLLFKLLERQPGTREQIGRTLRSLVRDTQALDLFTDTGLPRGAAFSHELISRIFARVLPEPPDSRNLDDLFDRLFPHASDADWLEQLEPELARQVVSIFQDEYADAAADWSGMRTDLEDALGQLADRICVAGSRREVRGRLPAMHLRDLPFQKLPLALMALLDTSRNGGGAADQRVAELNRVHVLLDGCDAALDQAASQLERTGVNTALVYDLARLRGQLHRLELLLEMWAAPEQNIARTLTLVADLVRQNHARKSITELFRQNLHLLTRRIVERNAETGEHYVARNGREYLAMLRSAAGGGAITGFTTLIKLLCAKLALAGFFQGALFGLNYATSFVAIQLCGFTLATKQPAATAPALARRMEELRTPAQLEALVDEVVFLIRSQIAAVIGNLALVIPATWLLDFALFAWRGHHVVDTHKAEVILQSVSPASAAWIFAILTGVLLWASSLVAAWADNWFVLHQLEPALAHHRRLQRWLGPTRVKHWAHWLRQNIAGLAGNISLGFMLGLFPFIAAFFGLPLDVRHVTLSTGQVTAAFAALGSAEIAYHAFLDIVIGILGIGALNVTVSFALALFVSLRARNVRGPQRRQFFLALARRILRAPWTFLLPADAPARIMP